MPENEKVPEIAALFFSNIAGKTSDGKAIVNDIFTSFLVWGFPSSVRVWFCNIVAFDFPIGKNTMMIYISPKKVLDDKATLINSFEIDINDELMGNIFSFQVQYQFLELGSFYIHVKSIETNTTVSARINVIKKEIDEYPLEKNIFKIDTIVSCSECKAPYHFEDSNDTHVSSRGLLPFPANGEFECEKCGHIMYLKDIQGQLRFAVINASKGDK